MARPNDHSSIAEPTRRFQLIAGALCVDFCNTVGGKRGGTAREFLNSYGDFLSWCLQVGLLTDKQLAALQIAAGKSPAQAAGVLKRALDLREAFYQVFLAMVKKMSPKRGDLSLINSELAKTLGRLRIAPVAGKFNWTWTTEDLGLDYPLGPLAHSAATLLTDSVIGEKMRQCQGDNCGWLFLDSSRNHSRCWCDMRDCGNRAKVRRHRLKKSAR